MCTHICIYIHSSLYCQHSWQLESFVFLICGFSRGHSQNIHCVTLSLFLKQKKRPLTEKWLTFFLNHTSIIFLIVSKVKSEKWNIYKGTLWSFHMKESKTDNTVKNTLPLFYFSLSVHSSSSAVVGIPDAPWAGVWKMTPQQIVLRLNCVQQILKILVHGK